MYYRVFNALSEKFSDVNVSVVYEEGKEKSSPHFNIYMQWNGMELYPSQIFTILSEGWGTTGQL